MPKLEIQLLGNFQLLYNGEPLDALSQGRLQSLLAYLVLHRDAPQPRQRLAFLCWPDSTDAQAQANLRQLLHRLQRAMPAADHFLQMAAKTVQWRPDAPFTLDVATFERQLTCADEAARKGDDATACTALQSAVAHYQGDLLPDCYDEWVLPERERWRAAYLKALEQLILLLEAQRDYAAAIAYAQRLLRHDPLHETTYGRLMRLHALAGDRASALRVYHTCATTLQRELGVEPSAQTRSVYEQLLNLAGSPEPPSTRNTQREAQLIGRQAEWQKLLTTWRKAASGHAHFLVVAGEAGIGKTRLVEELSTWVSRQGMRTARTRAYAAEGALAYAPVAEWLRTDALRAGWLALDAVWLTELARIFPELLVEQPHIPPPAPMAESWQRKRLFESLARAVLADNHPLLLVLDDLQWCDRETLEWLHYLLRYAPQAPLLVASTVRPEEIGSEHPLTALLLDLRSGGQVTELELGSLNLDETAALAAQVAGQALAPGVGQLLYQETEGNPLFVVETVRAREQRLETRELETPATPQSPVSNLQSLPPKVQAVIQRRLAQLSPAGQELASLAAVVGRSFAFQVLAQASDLAEDTLVRGLDELWQRRIVREQGVETYDFSHDRIRDVAYASMSLVHRCWLHRRVAQALEMIHATNLDIVSGQVAVQYEQAGVPEQAIRYYKQAADVARRIGAYDEATAQLNRGLALLATLPETAEHLQQGLALFLALGSVASATQGVAALEVGQIYSKALELCRRVDDKFQTFVVRQGLRGFYGHRGAWVTAHQLAEENLALAQELDEAELLQHAHMGMVMVLHEMGKHDLVQTHLKQVIHQSTTRLRGWDHLFFDDVLQAALRLSALTLWLLGYPDQARLRLDQAVTLGRTEDHVIRFAMTHRFALMLYHFLRETELVQTWTEELIALCTKYGFSHYLAAGMMHKGWLLTLQGEREVGIAQLQQHLTAQMKTGRRIFISYELALLSEAYWMAGQYSEGLATVQEGLAVVEQTGECFWQAELLRLKGELLLAQGASASEVEPCYRQAIEIARQQNAKSLELRATMSLARLWQTQGKQRAAHQMLSAVYGWFTEGFDTPDLQEARALLEALS